MALAWLLTLLAVGGVTLGVFAGQSRAVSKHLAATGGGLLFGIALFWLLPEIASAAGWMSALGLPLVACSAMFLADRALAHTGHSLRHGVVAPVLAATALHSFLDGWSVMAVSTGPVTNVAVPLGLALHKVPEGLALGWITSKSLHSKWKAALASGGVEVLTLIGAVVEPQANRAGISQFGAWWTAAMFAVIAGGFLFLGVHAILPSWRNFGVLTLFIVTLILVAFVRH
jgi:zinc transporter ZupT